MFALTLYFLSAFGLAYLVGHSAISEPVRTLIGGTREKPRPFFGKAIELVECPACFGTWVGAFAGALLPSLWLLDAWWQGAIVGALTTCATNFMAGKRLGLMPSELDPERQAISRMLLDLASSMTQTQHNDPSTPPPPPDVDTLPFTYVMIGRAAEFWGKDDAVLEDLYSAMDKIWGQMTEAQMDKANRFSTVGVLPLSEKVPVTTFDPPLKHNDPLTQTEPQPSSDPLAETFPEEGQTV